MTHYGCLTEVGVYLFATREQAERNALSSVVEFGEGEHYRGRPGPRGVRFTSEDQSTAQILAVIEEANACTSLCHARRVGAEVGEAIARDVLADDMDREWTGIDPQDGDRLTAAGIEPGTPEWEAAEEAAEEAYTAATSAAGDRSRPESPEED